MAADEFQSQPADESSEDTLHETGSADAPLEGEPSATLEEALGRYGIALPAEQVAKLDEYCQVLWDWNTKINLTRHTDYDRFVTRDVIDSLTVAELLEQGEHVLDLGTGGGVPGIILAIVRPDLHVTLSESIAKKALAVQGIVSSVKLPVRVEHARGEALLTPAAGGRHKGPAKNRFDTIVVRAVARLEKLLTWLNPHWDQFGRLLAIKGPAWVEERYVARQRRLLNGLNLRRAAVYHTPGSKAENVVLQIWPKDPQ